MELWLGNIQCQELEYTFTPGLRPSSGRAVVVSKQDVDEDVIGRRLELLKGRHYSWIKLKWDSDATNRERILELDNSIFVKNVSWNNILNKDADRQYDVELSDWRQALQYGTVEGNFNIVGDDGVTTTNPRSLRGLIDYCITNLLITAPNVIMPIMVTEMQNVVYDGDVPGSNINELLDSEYPLNVTWDHTPTIEALESLLEFAQAEWRWDPWAANPHTIVFPHYTDNLEQNFIDITKDSRVTVTVREDPVYIKVIGGFSNYTYTAQNGGAGTLVPVMQHVTDWTTTPYTMDTVGIDAVNFKPAAPFTWLNCFGWDNDGEIIFQSKLVEALLTLVAGATPQKVETWMHILHSQLYKWYRLAGLATGKNILNETWKVDSEGHRLAPEVLTKGLKRQFGAKFPVNQVDWEIVKGSSFTQKGTVVCLDDHLVKAGVFPAIIEGDVKITYCYRSFSRFTRTSLQAGEVPDNTEILFAKDIVRPEMVLWYSDEGTTPVPNINTSLNALADVIIKTHNLGKERLAYYYDMSAPGLGNDGLMPPITERKISANLSGGSQISYKYGYPDGRGVGIDGEKIGLNLARAHRHATDNVKGGGK